LIFNLIALAAAPTAAPTAAPAAPAPLASVAPYVFHQASWASQHVAISYFVQILFVIAVVGLVALMSIQTTKTEGLSGSIGGRMESAYKGRLGLDQQLSRATSGFAVAFICLAIVDFLITR
jgi:preprotein translocase subunit SecG